MRVVAQRPQPQRCALGPRDRLVGQDERQPGAIGQLEHCLGQLARRDIRPLDVLQHEDHRLLGPERLQPAEVRLRDSVGPRRARSGLLPESQEEAEGCEHVVELLAEKRAEPRPSLRPDGDLGLSGFRCEPAEEDLHERPRREASVRQAMTLEPGDALPGERLELGDETRLADSRRAREDDDSPATREEIVDDGPEHRDLLLAADARCGRRKGLARRRSYEA